jgi:hypothetical protein
MSHCTNLQPNVSIKALDIFSIYLKVFSLYCKGYIASICRFRFRFRCISPPWIIVHDIGQVSYHTITHYNKK